MIKHMVLFRFKDDVPQSTIDAILAEYATFPSHYPQMKRFDIGRNISWRDDRFTHAFVIEFDNSDDLDTYLRSDSHEEHVRERFRPVVAERAIVSFEYDPRTVGMLPERNP